METQLLCAENGNKEVDNCVRKRGEDYSLLLESQPRQWDMGSRRGRRRQMHRVPPGLRQQDEHVYDPVMVSLGPYHHGKPDLSRAEEFKYICLDLCAGGNEEKKGLLYTKILEKIEEIRDCYAEKVIVDDQKLALMMLLDGCFIIDFMERKNMPDWVDCLGLAASVPFATRDIMVLENQIPYVVIKLLMSFLFEAEEATAILRRFLKWITSVELNHPDVIPGENEEPPIHLLEACWRVVVGDAPSRQVRFPFQLVEKIYTCPSITDLKAKGIHFRPSSSQSLKDIVFKSGLSYGQLQLPVRQVSHQSRVILSNLIAYEVSPNTKTEPVVLSYINLMKSLIQIPEDVKELQAKGILGNHLSNQEQVVRYFKEINTFGLSRFDSFEDVKKGIEEHCNNKAKTWIAELIHTRFQTPWSIIAFFAATFLLCLTFLQTFFTIRPVK